MKQIQILVCLTLILASACKPEDPKPDDNNNNTGKNVTVKLRPLFSGMPVSWASAYITGSNDTVQFDRLKFIFSNFVFEKQDGALITIPNAYAFLSLKDNRDSFVISNVPEGSYKSFRFMLGLDSVTNHSDPTQYSLDHPLSPSLNEMHWGWAGGYIFNVIEGYYRKNGSNAGFSFHIASDKNVRLFSFVEDFTVQSNKRFLVDVHTDKYFTNVVNFSLKNDGAFSHSGDVDPVMDKFIQNLNGIFELKSIQ